MDSRNIATIFAPILFGSPPICDSFQFVKENEVRCIMFEFFLEFSTNIRVSNYLYTI